MKVIVFCNASFQTSDIRLGLQLIAQKLAERGHEVDYVATPSNPLDFISGNRFEKWVKSWLNFSTDKCKVSEGLTEWLLCAPFPRGRRFWFSRLQLFLYTILFPSVLRRKEYDVCIYDASFPALFRHRVVARNMVFRVNDNPEGFTFHMHPMVVEDFKNSLKGESEELKAVWPVSESLAEWVKQSLPELENGKLQVIPNGVDVELFEAAGKRKVVSSRLEKHAVYLGAINQWFDEALLSEVAELLPDWKFDIYGRDRSGKLNNVRSSRVVFHGSVPFNEVPELLSRYRVGLIPFNGPQALLNSIDPLKGCQYLAAGLGLVSTRAGRLGEHFSKVGCLGGNAKEFAEAILRAEKRCGVESEEVHEFLEERSWDRIINSIETKLVNFSKELREHR